MHPEAARFTIGALWIAAAFVLLLTFGPGDYSRRNYLVPADLYSDLKYVNTATNQKRYRERMPREDSPDISVGYTPPVTLLLLSQCVCGFSPGEAMDGYLLCAECVLAMPSLPQCQTVNSDNEPPMGHTGGQGLNQHQNLTQVSSIYWGAPMKSSSPTHPQMLYVCSTNHGPFTHSQWKRFPGSH